MYSLLAFLAVSDAKSLSPGATGLGDVPLLKNLIYQFWAARAMTASLDHICTNLDLHVSPQMALIETKQDVTHGCLSPDNSLPGLYVYAYRVSPEPDQEMLAGGWEEQSGRPEADLQARLGLSQP